MFSSWLRQTLHLNSSAFALLALACFSVGDATAQSTNVALERPTQADSERNTWYGSFKAVDGDLSNKRGRWISGDGPYPHWIEIELGNTYEIDRIFFQTGTPGSLGSVISEYQLQYWDGWDWIDIVAPVTNNFDATVDTSFPAAASGERIRFQANAGLQDNVVRLIELEVYGSPTALALDSRTPVPGESVHETNRVIEVTFSETITLADPSLLRYRDPADNSAISGFVASVSGSTLRLTPDVPMPYGQDIEIVVPAGVVESAASPGTFNHVLTWEFSTVPEVPQVVEHPVEIQNLTDSIDISFDRPVVIADSGRIAVRDVSTGSLLPGVAPSVNGSVLSLSHGGLALDEIYVVELLPGAVADAYSAATNDSRFAFAVLGGILTLFASDFDEGPDGIGRTGRWGWWDKSNVDGSLGSFTAGSSDPTKYLYTPLLSLDSSKSYRVNYVFSWINPGVAGIMPYLPDTSSDWQDSPDWELVKIGSGSASFSPSTSGDYRMLFSNHIDSVENGNRSSDFDALSILQAVAPAVLVTSPVNGAAYNEGATIPITFDAFGLAGEITSVQIYDPLDERQLASWTGPNPGGYSFDWSYYSTPGPRDLTITVTDSTGLQTVKSIPLTINLPDGSLPSLVHWDFDRSSEGFSGTALRIGADNGPGSGALKPDGETPFIASPEVFLLPGQSYTLSFDYKNQRPSTNQYFVYGFLPSPSPAYAPSMEPYTFFVCDQLEWTRHEYTFTVPESGPYHLILFNEDRVNHSVNDLLIDNVRLIGNFNSGPAVTLTSPSNGVLGIVGSSVRMTAEASDLDGTITEVRFMRGSRILFTDTTPPYEYDYVIPIDGALEVYAMAIDDQGGFSSTAPVTINAEPNNLTTSTYIGNASDDEAIRQVLYQPDGTLVVCGNLDPELMQGVSPLYLNGTAPGDRGVVARLTEDGSTVLNVTVVGSTVATDMAIDALGNLYLALGADGAVCLNPSADTVLWTHNWAKLSHRIDVGPNGTAVVLVSPQTNVDDKQLFSAEFQVVDAFGVNTHTTPGAGQFTTDVCIHEPSETLVGVAFENISTDNNPVDIPGYVGRGFDGTVRFRGYDWGGNPGVTPNPADFSNGSAGFDADYGSWDPIYIFSGPIIASYDSNNGDGNNPPPPSVADLEALAPDANSYVNNVGTGYLDAYSEWHQRWDTWLNRPANNMADTRGARCLIGEDGLLYLAFEFDGGNTPLRFDPFDLDTSVSIVGGDAYHEMSNTSTVPKLFIGRYAPETGDYLLGQWTTARLNAGGDNTFRIVDGDFTVDRLGRVHVVGESASNISMTHDFIPGTYRGGAYYLVFSPDFTNREMWTRFTTRGSNHGVAVSPGGLVAIGGRGTGARDDLFLTNPWQPSQGSSTDAILVVGGMESYFDFRVGEHPRLFFDQADIPELRSRLGTEPYQTIYNKMVEALDYGRFGDVYNPNFIYDRTNRGELLAFLYMLTGNEAYAAEARTHVEAAFVNTEYLWADPSAKGLGLYWIGSRVAIIYDLCVNSDAWDSAFDYQVSKRLYDMAKVIIEDGGSEQNPAEGSNWQGARGAAGALMALAMDHDDDRGLVDNGYARVMRYINAAYGGSGWLSEGNGYFYFPVGNYVGPMGIALARQDPARDLRSSESFSRGFWAAIASNVANTNVFAWGGIRPDWSNDNASIGGEGVYGLGFYYLPEELQKPYQFAYDHIQGTNSPADPNSPVWDRYRSGTIWSYLYYPAEGLPFQPGESYAWRALHDDTEGLGTYTFRDRFLDGEDRVAQMKLRLNNVTGGNDGPDGLGIRIIAGGAPFVIGGGRTDPARKIGQATVYRQNPSDGTSISINKNTGALVGTPLLTERGDGHVIGEMSVSNVDVNNHKRWFVANYDAAQTGAEAAFLIADTTDNGLHWSFNTYLKNAVTVDGNTFTVTGENGAVMKGTLLYPTSGFSITTGTKAFGANMGVLNGGTNAEHDPVANPYINEAKYVQIDHAGGDFLVALTVQGPGGAAHPVPVLNSGTVGDANVSIGSLQIALQPDSVLYGGLPYTFPDATVTFDEGIGGSIASGDAVQVIAYGGSPIAPTITADPGMVFTGWDKDFDPVVSDITITALYRALEPVPTDPDLLVASTVSATEIALNWRDNGFGETGYEVDRSPDGSSWSLLTSLAADVESYSDTGLSPETEYFYRVRALGTSAASGYSNTASATTDAPNTPPVFDNTGLLTANEGGLYFHTILASDPEDDPLTYTAVSLPGWLTLSDFGDGSADLVGTPGEGDTGDHAVTVSVSDGVNPPVEQTFTVSVNAAPEITLVSPAAQPARAPSNHGVEIELSVSDASAVSVTWSVVSGPGNAALDSPVGLVNGVTVDSDGTYTIRATATDSEGASDSMDVQVEWGGSSVSYDNVLMVDFAHGDQTTGRFRDTREADTTGLDLDGDLAFDDSIAHFSFRDDIPLSPATYASPDSRNFYGGLTLRVLNGTDNFGDYFVEPTEPYDEINIRFQVNDGEESGRFTGVFFWDKSDFANGGNTAPAISLTAGSSLSVPGGFRNFAGIGRWLVRSGSQYYVSQTLLSNDIVGLELSGDDLANEMWAEFNPVNDTYDMEFLPATATYDVPSSDLTDVTAVGLIFAQQDYVTYSTRIRFGTFQFTGGLASVENLGPVLTMNGPLTLSPSQAGPLGAALNDDGLPAIPGSVSVAWTVKDGPGTANLSSPNTVACDFDAATPGDYLLRLTADDGEVRTFAEMTVTVSGETYQSWIDGYGEIPVSERDPEDDWEGEGLTNWFEYGWGLNPTINDYLAIPVSVEFTSNRLELTADMVWQRDDVRYVVEVSDDLVTWTTLAEAAGGLPMTADPAAEPAPDISFNGTECTVGDNGGSTSPGSVRAIRMRLE